MNKNVSGDIVNSRSTEKCKFKESPLSVAIVMTGGTIAKTYNPETAVLENIDPVVEQIVAGLRLQDLKIDFVDLMHLDSLDMTARHRQVLVATVRKQAECNDAVIVTHGTDTLVETANRIANHLPKPDVPILFTGAMVPFVIRESDAFQNLTESLLALRLLPPGHFVVFHNRVMELPHVEKDHELLTFVSTHQI